MRKIILRLALGCILVGSATVMSPLRASADASIFGNGSAFYSGNSLYEKCRNINNAIQYNTCLGYIAGISDAMDLRYSVSGFVACEPKSATLGQVKDVAIQFLDRHPEWRHFSADILVARALSEAFPCN